MWFTRAAEDNCLRLALFGQLLFCLFPSVTRAPGKIQTCLAAWLVCSRDTSLLGWFSQGLSGASEIATRPKDGVGWRGNAPPHSYNIRVKFISLLLVWQLRTASLLCYTLSPGKPSKLQECSIIYVEVDCQCWGKLKALILGIKMTANDLWVKKMWHYPPRYKLHLCIGLLFMMHLSCALEKLHIRIHNSLTEYFITCGR